MSPNATRTARSAAKSKAEPKTRKGYQVPAVKRAFAILDSLNESSFGLTVQEVSKAKFQRPILPEELVRVCLKLSEQDGSIHVRAGFSVGAQPAGETQLLLWRSD